MIDDRRVRGANGVRAERGGTTRDGETPLEGINERAELRLDSAKMKLDSAKMKWQELAEELAELTKKAKERGGTTRDRNQKLWKAETQPMTKNEKATIKEK